MIVTAMLGQSAARCAHKTSHQTLMLLCYMPLLLVRMLSDITHGVETVVLFSVKNKGAVKKLPQPGGILHPLCKDHDTVSMLTLPVGSLCKPCALHNKRRIMWAAFHTVCKFTVYFVDNHDREGEIFYVCLALWHKTGKNDLCQNIHRTSGYDLKIAVSPDIL